MKPMRLRVEALALFSMTNISLPASARGAPLAEVGHGCSQPAPPCPGSRDTVNQYAILSEMLPMGEMPAQRVSSAARPGVVKKRSAVGHGWIGPGVRVNAPL